MEVKIAHDKDRAGRETSTELALDMPILPRWQLTLGMPIVVADPREGPTTAGAGDLQIENKVLVLTTLPRQGLVAAGLAVRLPTGSEARGLGGRTSVEPFLTAGLVLGRVYAVGELAYAWNVDAPGEGAGRQELTAGAAAGWALRPGLIPLLELTTVSRVRAPEGERAPKLRGRPQLYLTPGLNAALAPRMTWSLGLELPVTEAKAFDYALRGGIDWEF